jgi:hypothetical protein
MEEVDPGSICKEVLELLPGLASEKGVCLRLEGPEVSRTVVADAQGLHTVLLDLLTNAIEAFGSSGPSSSPQVILKVPLHGPRARHLRGGGQWAGDSPRTPGLPVQAVLHHQGLQGNRPRALGVKEDSLRTRRPYFGPRAHLAGGASFAWSSLCDNPLHRAGPQPLPSPGPWGRMAPSSRTHRGDPKAPSLASLPCRPFAL